MSRQLTFADRKQKQERNYSIFTTALIFAVMCMVAFSPESAFAQSVDLPWESFTQKVACTLTGPWVKWAAVIAIAIAGVMYGLGELSGPFQRVMQIAGGFSVAVAAVAVVGWLLPTGAGIASCV